MNKEIIVKSSISVKKSPELKQIRHLATAGLTEAEAIERNTIGEYRKERDDDTGDDTEE